MPQLQQAPELDVDSPSKSTPAASAPSRAAGILAMLGAAVLWGTALLIVFMGYRTIGSPWRTFAWAALIAATAGAVAVGFRYSLGEFTGRARWKAFGAVALASVVAVLLTQLVAASAAASVTGKQKAAWVAQRQAFEASPDGFGAVQALAQNQYGLVLELAHDDEAYLKTTQIAEGSSSAEMDLLPGYCMLSVWPHGVARSFESQPAFGVDEGVALRIIVLHELGHCVDMSRDAGSFTDPRVSAKSVAPMDAASVHDVATLYAAGRTKTTGQWREVYADLFAIGYARITYPAVAPAIARWLSAQRTATSERDPVHATACWIEASNKVAAPQGLADLPAWADRQRAGSNCKLSRIETR